MDLLGVNKAQDEAARLPPNMTAYQGKKSFAKGEQQIVVKTAKDKKKAQDEVWNDDDLKASSGMTVKDQGDDRLQPKYDVLLRQDLGSEDMYLNLGDRDPGSDHCSSIVVKIFLPDTELKQISLEVLHDRVLVQAPKYRLNLALPHRVKKDDGDAKWDKLKGELRVTLPIDSKITYVKDAADM